ncbi:MAG: sigma-54 dependent transcriptional regulator [Desulfoarculaceae bacterium]|nr:sigma-54 dependent transcriptional regulator [Desulfoarculaceae bacterium]
MAKNRTLLIVDDEENMRHMLQAMVSRHGYTVETAVDGQDALNRIAGKQFDFILCDIRMPHMDGIEFLQKAGLAIQRSTVIMMSAYGTIDMALEAIKAGAYDFISKPFKSDEVLLTLKKAEERESLRQENRLLKEQLEEINAGDGFDRMVASSKSMHSLFTLARKVAPYNTTVLIVGESGTGKELVARGIYASSPRNGQPFIAVNCGSIPENLLESEFFGYVKGAFTGAEKTRKGLLVEADKGTLFLDEIGELPLEMQVKLLRVLQEGEIKPVGSNKTEQIDVRILAATARNLEDEVHQGTFREDLFYRLNILTLHIPPLRERPEDIPLLCHHFLKKLNRALGTTIRSITAEAMARFLTHTWPGNVRELENIIQRGIVLADDQTIGLDQLPPHLVQTTPPPCFEQFMTGFSLKKAQKAMEEQIITKALKETGGNRLQASKLLELSYPSLLSKIKGYQIVIE